MLAEADNDVEWLHVALLLLDREARVVAEGGGLAAETVGDRLPLTVRETEVEEETLRDREGVLEVLLLVQVLDVRETVAEVEGLGV